MKCRNSIPLEMLRGNRIPNLFKRSMKVFFKIFGYRSTSRKYCHCSILVYEGNLTESKDGHGIIESDVDINQPHNLAAIHVPILIQQRESSLPDLESIGSSDVGVSQKSSAQCYVCGIEVNSGCKECNVRLCFQVDSDVGKNCWSQYHMLHKTNS